MASPAATRYRRRANVAVGVAIPVTAPATRPVRQIAGPPGCRSLVSFSGPPLTAGPGFAVVAGEVVGVRRGAGGWIDLLADALNRGCSAGVREPDARRRPGRWLEVPPRWWVCGSLAGPCRWVGVGDACRRELMTDSPSGFRDAQVGGCDDGAAAGDAESGKNTALVTRPAGPGGRSVGRGRTPRSRDR